MQAHAGHLFYLILIAFACGVGLQTIFDITLPVILWLGMLSGVLAFLWRRSSEAASAPVIKGASLILLALAIGMFRLSYADISLQSDWLEERVGEKVTIVGVVAREPDHRSNSTHLYVNTEQGKLLVKDNQYSTVLYGDQIQVTGKLTKPKAFLTDLGRTFQYPGYLKARGVSYIISYADVSVLESGQGNFVVSILLSGKTKFMDTVESLLPEPEVGLGEGLLLGVKRALGEELEKDFRATGIIHIVVLSGYNIMLVVIFISYILGWFFGLRLRSVFGLVAIVLFCLTVGLSATVMRAGIMAALMLLATLTNRTYMVLRALFLAAALMVCINPYILIFDPGFQLSFMATLGLIIGIEYIESWLTLIPTWLNLRSLLSATLVTQIFVLPLLLYHIGEFSLVAVVVNVMVLPMVAVAMLLTFISGLLGFVSFSVAVPISYLAYLSLTYIIKIATAFAGLSYAVVQVKVFPWWLMVISYVFLAALIWRIYKRETDVLYGWTIVEEGEIAKTVSL